jgi:uncharacterized protein YggE
MIHRLFLLILCVALLLTAGCAKKSNPATKVTVSGEAMIKVEPNTAVLVLSVVTQSAQALSAQQENARKSDSVSNAVKATAGSNVEIKTSDYTLQPQYDYRDNKLPRITSYIARNSVIVTMNELNKVGGVIDAASQAGANSIDGISFTVRQTSPVRGKSLAEATQQAMNKARSIAEALGGRVVRVVEESEGSTVSNGPALAYDLIDRTMEMSKQRMPTPIASGQLNIKSNVQLIVEIGS